jgi:2-iminobutanoate/2-iminopropanoate deaminase
MKREIISTSRAPRSKSPLSQAIRTEQFVYVSGQLGYSPDGGSLPEGVEAQTRQVLANLQAVLEDAGTSLAAVVKTTVFVTDISLMPSLNRVYSEFFPTAPPARSAVAVAGLAGGALVEIEAVALVASP